ncbi:hypothetical protein GGS21DRAFT_486237 [Xylaria nigripes]|nr:hypothetical protein GGS21DRAFT_486237 [Xylaria nigripes]
MSFTSLGDFPVPSDIPIWYAPEFQPEDLQVRPPHLGNAYYIKACKSEDPEASLILIDEEGRYRANVDIEGDCALLQLVLAGSQLRVRCMEVDGYFGTGRVEFVGSQAPPSPAAQRRVHKTGWLSRRKTRQAKRG